MMGDGWRKLVSDAGPGEGGVQAECGGGTGDSRWRGFCRKQDQADSRDSSLEVSWEVEIRGRVISVTYWRNLEKKWGPV